MSSVELNVSSWTCKLTLVYGIPVCSHLGLTVQGESCREDGGKRKKMMSKQRCLFQEFVWFPLHPTDVSEVHRFPRQYKGISTTDPRRNLGTLSEEPNCYVGNINSLGSGEKTGLSWACTADLWLLYVLGWPHSWHNTSPWGTGLHMCILCGKWYFFRDGPQIGQFASCSGLAGYAFLAPWARIALVS